MMKQITTNDPQSGIYFIQALNGRHVLASDPSFVLTSWIMRGPTRRQAHQYGCLYRGEDSFLIVLHDDRRIPFQHSPANNDLTIFATVRNILVTADPDEARGALSD